MPALATGSTRKRLADLAAKPYQANRVLVVLSQMLKLAERLDWRPLNSNPPHHVARHPETGRAKSTAVMLTPDQITALFDALAAERERGTDPYALAAIEVAFWTGWRLTSEVLPLQWDDLDLDNGIARLRDTAHLREAANARSTAIRTAVASYSPEPGGLVGS